MLSESTVAGKSPVFVMMCADELQETNVQTVYTAPNASMVYILKDMLERRGIECTVHGEGLLGAAGELAPVDAWVELLVIHDEDEAAAKRAVKAFIDNETSSTKPDWQCSSCGATVPGHFGVCWQCEESER